MPPRSQRSSGRSAPCSSCSRATAISPLAGFVLLGLGTAGLARYLVGDDDLELLFTRARGDRARRRRGRRGRPRRDSASCATPRSSRSCFWRSRPFAFPSSSATRRRSCSSRSTSCWQRRCSHWRTGRFAAISWRAPPFLLALPLASLVAFSATSYLWTWDERAGAIFLAFFVFPFTAGLAVVARAPLASWLPRALVMTLVVARLALRCDRNLAGADEDALLRARCRGRERLHDVLSRHLALQGSEPVRQVPGRAHRGAPRRRPPASWPDDRLGRRDGRRRVPLLGALLLVLAVELRRALRRHVRRRARGLGPTAPDPPGRVCARGDLGRSRGRGGRRERAIRERRDERPLAARERDPRCVSGPSHRRRRDRWPAARERGGIGQGLPEPERLAYDPAHGARGARSARFRALSLGSRRGRLGVVAPHEERPDLRRGPGGGAPRPRRALAAVCGVLRGSADVGCFRPGSGGYRVPHGKLRGCWHTDSRPGCPALCVCQELSSGSSSFSPCSSWQWAASWSRSG